MWILTVCLGILWGGMCDRTFQYTYPTEAACVFEMQKANARITDGYARCAKNEEVKK
jgi:hypothetical protein